MIHILFSFFFCSLPVRFELYTLSLHDALPIFLRHGGDKTLQVGYANHFYRSAHKFDWRIDRKSGSAGMPRPISYAVFCLKKNSIMSDPFLKHLHRKGDRLNNKKVAL